MREQVQEFCGKEGGNEDGVDVPVIREGEPHHDGLCCCCLSLRSEVQVRRG